MAKKTSRLTIPAEMAYIKAAVTLASEVSATAGFSESETSDICEAVTEACTNVVEHAFEPMEEAEFTISFEADDEGLSITIGEMGLPYSSRREKKKGATPGLRAMEERMDRVLYINRGKAGKELMLYKARRGKHVQDFFAPGELLPFEVCEIPSRETPFTVRLMAPGEALEVSRCIYRTYRYTYTNEDLYFPDRIEAMNRDGRMVSAVAVTEDGEVVGHFALVARPNKLAAEIGVAVVDPKYRKRGLMKKMLAFLIDKAKEQGLINIFGSAFTMHTLSQKTNLGFGMNETSLQLADFPPESIALQTEKSHKGAGNVIYYFKYLTTPCPYDVYLPAEHSQMLRKIYKGIGVERKFHHAERRPPVPDESDLHLSLKYDSMSAVLEVATPGRDLARRAESKLLDVEGKGFIAVYADLALSDPHTPAACEELESIGFFFSGILPDYSSSDVLRLQHYDTTIDYAEIETASEFAEELKEYVKALDPKWQAVHS